MASTWTIFIFFFFNDTATTEIYTLSLHDALPIFPAAGRKVIPHHGPANRDSLRRPSNSDEALKESSPRGEEDRKSTRLNSSHLGISYAVVCLKKSNRAWHPHR